MNFEHVTPEPRRIPTPFNMRWIEPRGCGQTWSLCCRGSKPIANALSRLHDCAHVLSTSLTHSLTQIVGRKKRKTRSTQNTKNVSKNFRNKKTILVLKKLATQRQEAGQRATTTVSPPHPSLRWLTTFRITPRIAAALNGRYGALLGTGKVVACCMLVRWVLAAV